MNMGCVKWGPSSLHQQSLTFQPQHRSPTPVIIYDTFPRDAFDMKSADPDFFTKEFETDVYELCSDKKKVRVHWKITVHRIGKCLVGNSIPIEDDPDRPNKDINDRMSRWRSRAVASTRASIRTAGKRI
jgi:hypothetical protein